MLGLLSVITTDQGSEFRNEVNAALMVIKHRLTTAYHPQANGLDERYNQTLINSLEADGWIQAGKDSTIPIVEEEACRLKGEIPQNNFSVLPMQDAGSTRSRYGRVLC